MSDLSRQYANKSSQPASVSLCGSATCEQASFEKIGGVDVLIDPSLIVEVLSKSTEAYDRGDKFTHYKSISAFQEYLLVAQHRPHVTQYARQKDDSWSYRELNELDSQLALPSLDCELKLKEFYEGVVFQSSSVNIHPSA